MNINDYSLLVGVGIDDDDDDVDVNDNYGSDYDD